MIRHAARGLPWGVIAAGAVLLPGFLALVQLHAMLWPLQGTAVGMVAATAVWCFDEPLAAIVDTTPRNLRWRTAARSAGVVLILIVWVAAVALTRGGLYGHAPDVAWQGIAAALGAGAFVTWRRARGVATPAQPIAAAAVAGCVFVALARPFDTRLPIFPFTAADNWVGGRVVWGIVAGSGVVLLIAQRVARRS